MDRIYFDVVMGQLQVHSFEDRENLWRIARRCAKELGLPPVTKTSLAVKGARAARASPTSVVDPTGIMLPGVGLIPPWVASFLVAAVEGDVQATILSPEQRAHVRDIGKYMFALEEVSQSA